MVSVSYDEVLSSYSKVTVSSSSAEFTISTRDSASKCGIVVEEEEEVYEDASSDISILTRRHEPPSPDRSKMHVAVHHDLCQQAQKVLEPLFLRKCEPLKVRQGSAPPSVRPIQMVETLAATKKSSAHSALMASLDAPTYCVRYLAANRLEKAENVLVYVSPMFFVRFVARPDEQNTVQSQFEDISEKVHLLMSPDNALVAKKMLPKWQTVTFTLAFGKHVAVKYRIIETRKQPIIHVKTKMERVKRVSTKTLYRTEPVQRVEHWRSLKAHELKLSTVEKNDPQMVKKVFLEQAVEACSVPSVVEEVKVEKIRKKHQVKELNLMWQRTDL